jgi:hypothetical protein
MVSTSTNGYSADPFPPSTSTSSQASNTAPVQPKPINISDESSFPSLSSGGGVKKAGPTWGAGGTAAQRIKQQQPSPARAPAPTNGNGVARAAPGADATRASPSGVRTATVQLPTADIHVQSPSSSGPRGPRPAGASREVEPTTLGEVMKLLMKKYAGVSVEASTSRAITTFIIKGKAEEDVAKAKRELLSRLSKKVTIEVQVPAGMRAFIIGAKGESHSPPPRSTLTAHYDQVATSSR